MTTITQAQFDEARAAMSAANTVLEQALDARPEAWDGTVTAEEIAAETAYAAAKSVTDAFWAQFDDARLMPRLILAD